MSGVDGQEPPGGPVLETGAGKPRHRPGRWWRWPLSALVLLIEGILLILILGGSMLAWRAAQGPVDVSWLLPRLGRVAAMAEPQYRISVAHLAFNWRGFSRGPDQPVQIAADGIAVANPARHQSLTLDHLALDLSAAWAVRGVFAPRVITLDGLHVTLRRPAAAAAGPRPARRHPVPDLRARLRDAIAVLRQPPQTDRHLVPVRFAGLSELQRVTVTGSSLVLEPAPRPAAPPPAAPPPAAPSPASPAAGGPDLTRRVLQLGEFSLTAARADQGGIALQLAGVLASRGGALPAATAGERPSLALRGLVTRQGVLSLSASAMLDDPAGMFAALGMPASLPVPAMPLQANASLTLSSAARITALTAALSAGAGEMRINGAHIPVASLNLHLTGDESAIRIDPASRIVFGAVSEAPAPTLSFSGSAQPLAAGGFTATLGLSLDHVASDDVPAYWPPGFADGARAWIKAQVRGGSLDNGTFAFGFKSDAGLGDLALVSVAGGIPAEGLAVTWLPGLPPLTVGQGAVILQGMDKVLIKVDQARQGALALSPSSMVISGLTGQVQTGTIAVNFAGPVAAVVALLNQPRLGLLKSVPLPLKVTAGTVKAAVKLSLPLLAKVTTGQITLDAKADVTGLALGGLLLGRDLTDGQFAISASMAMLHLSGPCRLATIPLRLSLDALFAPKTADQAVAMVHAEATATPAQLAAAGVPTGGLLHGSLAARLDLAAAQNGRTDIDATVNLPASHLRISQIGWAGGAGQATATAHIVVQGSRIAGFDPVALKGPGIDVQVQPAFTAGRLSALDIPRFILGRTDINGRIGLPAGAGAPYDIRLGGRTLDLAGLFGRKAQPSVAPTNQALSQISARSEFAPHPPWRISVSLGRILFGTMAGGRPRELDAVRGQAVNNGRIVQSADLALTVAPSGAPTRLLVVQNGRGGRQVTLTSGDLGGFLKATNIYDLVDGGVLRIDAAYNDQLATHPLTGIAEMDKFTLGDAPTIGKILQAMTLYGLVDLLHGSGLFFSKLIMPFRLESRTLTLTEARAYSASLGLTADGTVDLPANSFDLKGTVVPAYFFNALLGHIPVIGRLFSPEKGGGLFAADFRVLGPIDNPSVHVNALSMVAPGILRNLFQKPGPAKPPAAAPAR